MSRKPSLEEIAERRILAPGQEYVAEYLARAMLRPESPIGVHERSVATDTCKEKIELLKKPESKPLISARDEVKA